MIISDWKEEGGEGKRRINRKEEMEITKERKKGRPDGGKEYEKGMKEWKM